MAEIGRAQSHQPNGGPSDGAYERRPCDSRTSAPVSTRGIPNATTLQGFGTVSAPVTDAGTLEAIGGSLSFTAPLGNSTAGLIRASTSSKVLAFAGLATNARIINLSGGTFDNGSKPLVNAGQLTVNFARRYLGRARGVTNEQVANLQAYIQRTGEMRINFTAGQFGALLGRSLVETY